ncbi:hypothetical protein JOM56_004453, partial [Amanita muscaria]
FISHADSLYGLITTIRCDGQLVKKIKWSVFTLEKEDWAHVKDATIILEDSNRIQQHFSADREPTLWRALPAIEELQTVWEAKRDNPRFMIYKTAIQEGLDKLNKYYSRFDEKPSFVLALVLHPYYKLDYIKMAWGGEKEQQAERDEGNLNAKNWQDEARKVLENTMEHYWRNRYKLPATSSCTSEAVPPQGSTSILSDFDRYREARLQEVDEEDEEGWEAEMRRYLKVVARNIMKESDIVEWWQVHFIYFNVKQSFDSNHCY